MHPDFNEYFKYEDGVLVWSKPRGPRTKVGQRAGSVKEGYLRVKFFGRSYYVHRIIWFMHYGIWPSQHLDHINRDKLDNRLENLRDISSRFNQHNTDQFNFGATYCKRDEVWFSRYKIGKKALHLGSFKTEAKAQQAYRNKLLEYEE